MNGRSINKLAGAMLIFSAISLAAGTTLVTPTFAAPADKSAKPASAAKAGLPKVLDFGADWCAPCKKFAPVFDKVSLKYKDKVQFVHYDAEKGEGKTMADKFKVSPLPTVIFLDAKGKTVSRVEKLMTEAELTKNTDALLK